MDDSEMILAAGFFAQGFDSYEGVVLISDVEHPQADQGESAEFQCAQCDRVEFGPHVSCWSVDTGEEYLGKICTSCARGYAVHDAFFGLTEDAVNQLLVSLAKNPGPAEVQASASYLETEQACSFGDEEVHAHEISFPTSARYKEITAAEHHGAWLVCSLTGCAFVIPDEPLHAGDDSIEFLSELVIRVRAAADQFMECSEWIEIVEKLGRESFTVSADPSYSYVMGLGSAAEYLINQQLASSSTKADWMIV